MSIQETFPLVYRHLPRWRGHKADERDGNAMAYLEYLDEYTLYGQEKGIAYALGSWGYTSKNLSFFNIGTLNLPHVPDLFSTPYNILRRVEYVVADSDGQAKPLGVPILHPHRPPD